MANSEDKYIPELEICEAEDQLNLMDTALDEVLEQDLTASMRSKVKKLKKLVGKAWTQAQIVQDAI